MFWKTLVTIYLLAVAVANAAEHIWDWRDTRPGEVPGGFRAALSGAGQPGQWNVLLDEAPSAIPAISTKATNRAVRPVLVQLSTDRADGRYPMLVFDGDTFSDFTLTTQFKIVGGAVEQMAGIAFRIQDERNYYYIRASALGQNVSFFKMEEGQLFGPFGANAQIPKGVWQELMIRCEGNQIRCSLNGQEIASFRENTFNSGKIGFWTKSDSISYFGETRLTYKTREPLAQSLVRDTMKKYPRLQSIKIFAAPLGGKEPKIIASTDPAEVGQLAQNEAADVIARGIIYHGQEKGKVLVTLPLRDNNGDSIAAVKVVMKAFPGQTEKNAITRALPIVKQLEARVRTAAELTQ